MSNIPAVWAVAIMLVVAVFGSAGVASLLTVRAVNKRTMAAAKLDEETADRADAEARKLVTEAGVILLEPLTRRAEKLEQQLTAALADAENLRTKIAEMSKEMTELRDENTRLRDEKPWRP